MASPMEVEGAPPAPGPLVGKKGPATFFVPGEPLASKGLKEGDAVTLTVVSIDPENGDVEMKLAEGTEETTPEQDLRPMLEEAFT